VIVGAYVRTFCGNGNSTARCEDTSCDDCRVLMTDVIVKGSEAVSRVTSELFRS
jgi:hypothetical protein